ncbi:hypothetical protein Zmor_006023 [Zophobas morio]|uniref:Uncharacterized protein n=1 Tax=Zophobas morio TaxID=2755281 RepID=A0AA38IR10_9CUCU|nr:hypothetical protein Zmor_006023 [Zophobas morio]
MGSRCCECGKNVKSFGCDACKKIFCKDCGDLSETEIRALDLKNRKMRFFCQRCGDAMALIPQLSELIKNLQQQVEQLTMKYDQLNKNIFNEDSVTNELQDRLNRAKNVIVYTVPESKSKETNVRIQQDSTAISKIITEDLELSVNAKKVIRLGKVVDSSKPRPIKIVCKDADDALDLLRNRGKCLNNIKLNNDLTPMQREKLKTLRNQLEERKSKGEKNLTLKYIKGVPTITTLTNNASQKN